MILRRGFLICILAMLWYSKCYLQEHSLIFVHLGQNIPSYTFTSLKQARFMNETCDIYLLTSRTSIQNLDSKIKEELLLYSISLIDIDALPVSQEHLLFRSQNSLSDALQGFWKYTTERFFVIFDFLKVTKMQSVE